MTDDLDPRDPDDAIDGEPAPLSDADEIELSALLAQLPDPVVPDDVEAGIAAALAHDPATTAPPPFPHATTIVPSHAAPRGRRARRPRVLQGAAAVLALALIGAAVVGVTTLVGNDDGTTTGDTASAPTTVVTASGRDYTADTVAEDVRLLLDPNATPSQSTKKKAGASSGGTLASTGGGEGEPGSSAQSLSAGGGKQDTAQTLNPPSPSAAEIAAVSALVRTPATRDRCVQTLAGEPGATPIAIDIAAYDGRAAAVIVLPHAADPTEVEVWIVGSTCSDNDSPFPLHYAQVPRP